MLGHIFGSQPAEDTQEADLRDASCGPPPGGGCGPPTSCEVDFICKASPQPSGRACDFRGAALRPGAGAGCRSLRDRARRNILRNKQRLRAAAASYRSRKFKMQYSRFKITTRDAACGGHAASVMNCGPPPPQAAARSVLTNRRRLRVAAPGWAQIQNEQTPVLLIQFEIISPISWIYYLSRSRKNRPKPLFFPRKIWNFGGGIYLCIRNIRRTDPLGSPPIDGPSPPP